MSEFNMPLKECLVEVVEFFRDLIKKEGVTLQLDITRRGYQWTVKYTTPGGITYGRICTDDWDAVIRELIAWQNPDAVIEEMLGEEEPGE